MSPSFPILMAPKILLSISSFATSLLVLLMSSSELTDVRLNRVAYSTLNNQLNFMYIKHLWYRLKKNIFNLCGVGVNFVYDIWYHNCDKNKCVNSFVWNCFINHSKFEIKLFFKKMYFYFAGGRGKLLFVISFILSYFHII